MKKKVCFLLFNLDPGGLETYLIRYIEFLNGQFDITVVCKSGRTGQLESKYLQCDVNVVKLKTGYINFIGWFKLFRFFRKMAFDSVCDLTSNFAGIYMFIGALSKINRRIAYYGQSSDHFRTNLFSGIYNRIVNGLVFSYSTSIVANSESSLDYFFFNKWKNDKRFFLINNGVNTLEFSIDKDFSIRRMLNISDSSIVIGHTGRYDEKKNQKAIVEVAKYYSEKKSDIYFILCGKDTHLLQSEIVNLHLESRIFLLGYREDIPIILRNLDVFYFPSYTEGQPNSLIEALLTGLPVVTSNIPPIKETLPESLWGQMVNPDDINSAIKLIDIIIEGGYPVSSVEIRKWAEEKYDSIERFNEFKEVLI